jgi:hypothetical protein
MFQNLVDELKIIRKIGPEKKLKNSHLHHSHQDMTFYFIVSKV